MDRRRCSSSGYDAIVHARPAAERGWTPSTARGCTRSEGSPPDMLQPPAACPFQPRCRSQVDESRRSVPSLVEVERGQGRPASTRCRPKKRQREAATALTHAANGAGPLSRPLPPEVPIKSGLVLDRHVGDIRAVDDISLTIKKGETVVGKGAAGNPPSGAQSSASTSRQRERSTSTVRTSQLGESELLGR